MKAFVVTLFEVPESVEAANRCIESGKQYGFDVSYWKGIYRDQSISEIKKEGLKIGNWNKRFSNPDAVLGNFISQYRLWKMIATELKEPSIVLEHDAVFVNSIPSYLSGDVVNLGAPSYGNYNTKDKPGLYKFFSKRGGYFPGAHGYYVTPKGAQTLVNRANKIGAHPCDIFLCRQNVPDLLEIYPWIIVAKDTFTTIQKEEGCKVKHGLNSEYKILT